MPNLQGKIELIKQSQVDIKDAIIEKGVTPTGNISTYADAIGGIVTPNNQSKTVTTNGVVRYDEGYTGLEQVTVNLPLGSKNITNNGTYIASTDSLQGYNSINVNVLPDLDTKTITANGIYNASSDNVDGYSSVTVNIADKDMNYWEAADGECHNFYTLYDELGHIALDVGQTIIGVKLKPFMTVDPVQIANLNALEQIIVDYCCEDMFADNTTIVSANFKNLQSIEYHQIFKNTFKRCTNLQTINFPSLNNNSFGTVTDQFHHMLDDVNGCIVHFPSNLQVVIGSWSDVQNGFGGRNIVVLFDLPATT